ncbi:CDP-glycerol glycerophosphotransferase family protein [Clostridium tyrobutyricum]|uniref:CDP-glycerol glycerophosphotransferase family protein n=1 Tax=Clostridium tyrobutyricum TaxID=1519 RepID=UPI001C383F3A|nr:CDP-glycerol glycerophosphotransferase family protein [Clostridium tyrobutyricum]MBV4425513.1 CDP-glycerol glycerophosphotransferase family protein [Clostridium tyrobutyricum]
MKKFIIKICRLINMILKKKKNKICFCSFPDFSDNCMAIFNYIIEKKLIKYEIIWLVDNYYVPDSINLLKEIFKIKVIKKNSILGVYNYMTSKYIFYTHGLFKGVECLNKQIVINLWHGMPLKNIEYLDNKTKSEVPKFTYTIATSVKFQDILSKAFCVDKNNVLITGSPRNDKINEFKNILSKLNIEANKCDKKILWMPTYRKSIIGELRTDGNYSLGKLPLLNNEELKELNKYLKNNNDFLIIKLHPMDKLQEDDFDILSNIKIITKKHFENIGEQLYSIFQEVDALITDYSSVYFDFLLLDKPIGFIMDDLSKYKNNRGFVFKDIYDWIPGPIINELDQLYEFIEVLNNNIDNFADIRKKINKRVNKYSDFKSTERLLKILKI